MHIQKESPTLAGDSKRRLPERKYRPSNLSDRRHSVKSGKRKKPIRVGSRAVGHVKGKVFAKRIRGSKHLLKHPPAISFDVTSLQDAEALGARTIKVVDIETNEVYVTPFARIWEEGIPINRGYGNQLALVLSYWDIYKKGVVHQLKLF